MCKNACNGVCSSEQSKTACNSLQQTFDKLIEEFGGDNLNAGSSASNQLSQFNQQLEDLTHQAENAENAIEAKAINERIETLKLKLERIKSEANL